MQRLRKRFLVAPLLGMTEEIWPSPEGVVEPPAGVLALTFRGSVFRLSPV